MTLHKPFIMPYVHYPTDLKIGDIVFTRIANIVFTNVAVATCSWTNHVGIIVGF